MSFWMKSDAQYFPHAHRDTQNEIKWAFADIFVGEEIKKVPVFWHIQNYFNNLQRSKKENGREKRNAPSIFKNRRWRS